MSDSSLNQGFPQKKDRFLYSALITYKINTWRNRGALFRLDPTVTDFDESISLCGISKACGLGISIFFERSRMRACACQGAELREY